MSKQISLARLELLTATSPEARAGVMKKGVTRINASEHCFRSFIVVQKLMGALCRGQMTVLLDCEKRGDEKFCAIFIIVFKLFNDSLKFCGINLRTFSLSFPNKTF